MKKYILILFIIFSIFISCYGNKKNKLECGFNLINTIKIHKRNELIGFFQKSKADIQVASKTDNIKYAFKILYNYKNKMNIINDENYNTHFPEYKIISEELDSFFKDYIDFYGYYDVFLISSESGQIMYTYAKERDLGVNMKYEKDQNLVYLYDEMLRSNKPVFSDIKQYKYNDYEPAMFLGCPVFENDKIIGVIVFQMPINYINSIVQDRTGLGETGEIYLIGEDKLMRSDSVFNDEYSIKYSLKNNKQIDTEAVNSVLSGRSGFKIILDHYGNTVLSTWDIIVFDNFRWGIIVEINEEEVLK